MAELKYTSEELFREARGMSLQGAVFQSNFFESKCIRCYWEDENKDFTVYFIFREDGTALCEFFKGELLFHTMRGEVKDIVDFVKSNNRCFSETVEAIFNENGIINRSKIVLENLKTFSLLAGLTLYFTFIGMPLAVLWTLFVTSMAIIYTLLVPFNTILWILTGYNFYKTASTLYSLGPKIINPFDEPFSI